MSNSLEFALTKDTSVFLSPSWCQKMQKNHSCCNTERLLCCVYFFLKSHVSGFWMTEESLWPPGCNCLPLQPLQERVSVSEPSAHIYCLCSSLWSPHPPCRLMLIWVWRPRAPTCGARLWFQGRISLSKCLAGKYVTRLVNDPALCR